MRIRKKSQVLDPETKETLLYSHVKLMFLDPEELESRIEELEKLWKKHRESLIKQWKKKENPNTMPWAWWEFDFDDEMPTYLDYRNREVE